MKATSLILPQHPGSSSSTTTLIDIYLLSVDSHFSTTFFSSMTFAEYPGWRKSINLRIRHRELVNRFFYPFLSFDFVFHVSVQGIFSGVFFGPLKLIDANYSCRKHNSGDDCKLTNFLTFTCDCCNKIMTIILLHSTSWTWA
ncbi:unnamed protein product [Lactuca virosa]|uniref:Uncharacterized protein n=1 Tax=Lactuca virosa TaxID=75947 RepID=A0AAU9PIZ1_9ASTR|nr:unnamed protein product [Lactuca virosa]